ncbi:flagellar motor protein MotB [Paracerasibacillus soli]|uniref:Flagellar motor protein MotB n=1 Tax=Paracerasibacillus soli TaxID=480284 RepID=A0ABU5CSX9_9BACI|nr:flagellar motor protein MotB [Virgibacillus soli]MDY0408971.1 flagellar motor protein MotB [Virgibacillus soli]
MRKQRQRHKESEMDESWLLPYSDLLTLLLALFIVLFAMSEVDTQKYKELSQVFKSEFSSGGGGILEQQKPGHDSGGLRAPKTEAKETRDEANDKTENSGALELERLQDVQKDINEYIHANKLDGKIGTRLTDEGLYITIQNGITFTPGSSQVNAKGKKMAKEISRFLETDRHTKLLSLVIRMIHLSVLQVINQTGNLVCRVH